MPTKANLKTLKKINIRRQNHHLEIEYQMMLPTKPKVSNEVHLSRLVCKNRFDANQCARARNPTTPIAVVFREPIREKMFRKIGHSFLISKDHLIAAKRDML